MIVCFNIYCAYAIGFDKDNQDNICENLKYQIYDMISSLIS